MSPAARTSPQAEPSPAPSEAPSLAALQDMFQRAVLEGDGAALLALVPDSAKTTRDVLFGVYQYAYAARLVEILCNDHPLLNSLMGDAAFRDMARAYVRTCPSQSTNARWFSSRLPGFLAAAEPYRTRPEYTELASLERELDNAFDAADAEVLSLADLAAFAPETWADLVFSPHPSARRLDVTTNAFAIWSALKTEEPAPVVITLPEPQRLIVWRQDMTAMVRAISPEEAMMWAEAAKGVPFGQLCELAAVYDDPDTAPVRAAQYLQFWIGSGALSTAARRSKTKPRARRRVVAE